MTDSAPDTHGLQDHADPPALAAKRTEAVRSIAESSATAYVDLITSEGAEVDPHRAFVDGFMTAIETLLTAGARRV